MSAAITAERAGLQACSKQPGMCPAEETCYSASFGSLPTHVQTLIFASAGACLTTCKASAALAQDACITAKWLLQQHRPEPLGRAAKHQLWDVCHHLLDTFSYQPTERDLYSGVVCSGKYGKAALMSRLLQSSCQEEHIPHMVCASVRNTLVVAARGGHVGVVNLLVSHPSCTAQYVRDAVCGAVSNMHLEVLRLLVSSRPDAGSPKLRGSPMEVAAKLGDIAAMEVLVQHGADVNGSKGSAWRSDTDPTEPTHARRSPLWMAVGHDRVKAVAWLLQQGISGEGSGLGLALKAAAWQLDTTLMDMLLSYSPTQAVIPRYGPSALLTAVECGHAEAAEELLKAGVPSTAQAIQHAEGLDGERDVRERLRRFLSWDEAYEQSSAILQAAIEHGHADFAQLLREARAAAAAAAGTATRTAAAAPPPAP